LDILQFESDHPGKLNSTAVMLCVRQHLATAEYSLVGSSNAKSLCGAFLAVSPKIEAATPPDFRSGCISEFESSHPSQTVRSLQAMPGLKKSTRCRPCKQPGRFEVL
jgi:hypothetical protein